jgi:hypothetical protein
MKKRRQLTKIADLIRNNEFLTPPPLNCCIDGDFDLKETFPTTCSLPQIARLDSTYNA